MSKTVLISGAAGFIGSALFRHLEATTDHRVGGIDEMRRGNPGSIPCAQGDYAWLHVDQLAACDVIVHLAAHATVAECEAEPLPAFYNNLVHVVNLATKLNQTVNPIRAGRGLPAVELIYASTGSLYSANGMASHYDMTKRALEEAMRLHYPAAVGLRFATVCGPSPNPRRTLLNAMVDDAMAHGKVTVCNPQARRPVVDIRDLCRVVGDLVERPLGGVFDVVSYSATIKHHALSVAKFLGDVEIERGADSPTYDFEMQTTCGTVLPPMNETATIDALVQDWRERTERQRTEFERHERAKQPEGETA